MFNKKQIAVKKGFIIELGGECQRNDEKYKKIVEEIVDDTEEQKIQICC